MTIKKKKNLKKKKKTLEKKKKIDGAINFPDLSRKRNFQNVRLKKKKKKTKKRRNQKKRQSCKN